MLVRYLLRYLKVPILLVKTHGISWWCKHVLPDLEVEPRGVRDERFARQYY